MTRAPLPRSSAASSSGYANGVSAPGLQNRRARIQLRRIPDEKQRRCTFQKRKKGLLKKASELAKMCDVEVCVISTGHSDNNLDEKFDSKFEWSVPGTKVEDILDRYQATPVEQREKKKLDYVSHLELQIKKTEKEMANMKQLNRNLEEEIFKKLAADMPSILKAKCEVDAALEALRQAGMTGEVDQTQFYKQDVPSHFQNSNRVPQGLNPSAGFPLALPATPPSVPVPPQNGSANGTAQYRLERSDQSRGREHCAAPSTHGLETYDGHFHTGLGVPNYCAASGHQGARLPNYGSASNHPTVYVENYGASITHPGVSTPNYAAPTIPPKPTASTDPRVTMPNYPVTNFYPVVGMASNSVASIHPAVNAANYRVPSIHSRVNMANNGNWEPCSYWGLPNFDSPSST